MNRRYTANTEGAARRAATRNTLKPLIVDQAALDWENYHPNDHGDEDRQVAHLGPDGGNSCDRYPVLVSLLAIQQAEGNASLVIEATAVVAADVWWVFRNADDRPVATLPTAAVCAIDPLPPGDERGHAWAQAGNTVVLASRPHAKAS